MKNILLFIIILFLINCENKARHSNKVFLPKLNINRTQNPNYSHYFPNKLDSSDNQSQSEPIPNFNSKHISNSNKDAQHSSSFFSSIINIFQNDNKKSEEQLCSEILDINKTILSEQNTKLKVLNNDKKQLIKTITNLEQKIEQQMKNTGRENNQLKQEIYRLNQLIKILSTEIK